MVQAGQYVTDGTAVFIVTDIRDGAQVGDIKLSPILRNGYIKANGAVLTSARTNYPRLITFITENPSLNAADDTAWNSNKALYVYNSSADTLRVPDATGRVLQGGSAAGMVNAGLPDITGNTLVFAIVATGTDVDNTRVNGFSKLGNLASISKINTLSSAENYQGKGYSVQEKASFSNSIYSASTTVQPPALSLIPQIKY